MAFDVYYQTAWDNGAWTQLDEDEFIRAEIHLKLGAIGTCKVATVEDAFILHLPSKHRTLIKLVDDDITMFIGWLHEPKRMKKVRSNVGGSFGVKGVFDIAEKVKRILNVENPRTIAGYLAYLMNASWKGISTADFSISTYYPDSIPSEVYPSKRISKETAEKTLKEAVRGLKLFGYQDGVVYREKMCYNFPGKVTDPSVGSIFYPLNPPDADYYDVQLDTLESFTQGEGTDLDDITGKVIEPLNLTYPRTEALPLGVPIRIKDGSDVVSEPAVITEARFSLGVDKVFSKFTCTSPDTDNIPLFLRNILYGQV